MKGSATAALQRVADAALASLSEDELLPELLLRITEVLGTDTAAILLFDETRQVLRARAAKGIEEEVEQGVEIPVGKGFAGRIAADRRAIIIDDVDHADILNPILREKGIRSLLGVPLLAEDRVLGVLHVGSLKQRHFTPDERDLLQLAGERAAIAIQHAQLYERERSARIAAEAAKRRLEAVAAGGRCGVGVPLGGRAAAGAAAADHRGAGDRSGGDPAARRDPPGAACASGAGIEEEVEQGVEIPVGKGFAGRVVADRRAIIIDDLDHADIFNPILREKGIRSLLGVPLLAEDRVLGVLHVGSLEQRHFTPDERDLLQLAGERAAIAIQHAQLYEERQLAAVLQRRLLPDLHGVRGLEVASRYQPASGATLGGDWYDAFALSGGRIAVVAGDVVGHGVTAAATMAQLRTALRAYAVEGHPAGGAVERVNSLIWDLGSPTMTTLAYVVIDPDRESLEAVVAGHPPPLMIPADGQPWYLPVQGNVPLGTSPFARYRCAVHPFPTGTALLLFTDGLVETRGASIDEGLARVLELSAEAGSIEALCTRLVERMVPREPADDVAIIAARLPPPPVRLSGRWPARLHTLADVRRLLRRWLLAQGASDDEVADIVVACQEACTNTIEHASGPGSESFEVEATCDAGRVRVTVRDGGGWRAPRGTNRGRGLPIMRELMDSVEVRPSAEGTVVVLERSLGGGAA